MEFVCQKRTTRNRKRKRHNKRRKRSHFEVMFSKHTQNKLINFSPVNFGIQSVNTMEAKAFWQNYAAAQDWQKRHSVVWWRTKCHALEHENSILKDKIRNLVKNNYDRKLYSQDKHVQSNTFKGLTTEKLKPEEHFTLNDDADDDSLEDLEFQMNDDMMKFLEQSIRHKMELKKIKESTTKNNDENEKKSGGIELSGGKDWFKERSKCAELLYGEASSRILAMETALQATNERHIDKAKPQFWPNIPLNIKFD